MNNNPPVPCVPHTPCWCEKHPNNPNCKPTVLINENLSISIVIAILIGFYVVIRRKIKLTT